MIIVQRKERGREICVIGYTRKCLPSVGELCSLYQILSQHVVASYDIYSTEKRGNVGYTRK